MADVLNRITKELRRSANSPDFPVDEWIHGPDLSAVAGYPAKYWEIAGDSVRLMNKPSRDAVDAALASAALTADRDAEKSRLDTEKVLVALCEILVGEFNALRALHGLPARTMAQLRTAIKGRIDNG